MISQRTSVFFVVVAAFAVVGCAKQESDTEALQKQVSELQAELKEMKSDSIEESVPSAGPSGSSPSGGPNGGDKASSPLRGPAVKTVHLGVPFTGIWQNNVLKIALEQNGSEVVGEYEDSTRGFVHILSGTVMNGRFEYRDFVLKGDEPEFSYSGWFEVSGDGQSLKGEALINGVREPFPVSKRVGLSYASVANVGRVRAKSLVAKGRGWLVKKMGRLIEWWDLVEAEALAEDRYILKLDIGNRQALEGMFGDVQKMFDGCSKYEDRRAELIRYFGSLEAEFGLEFSRGDISAGVKQLFDEMILRLGDFDRLPVWRPWVSSPRMIEYLRDRLRRQEFTVGDAVRLRKAIIMSYHFRNEMRDIDAKYDHLCQVAPEYLLLGTANQYWVMREEKPPITLYVVAKDLLFMSPSLRTEDVLLYYNRMKIGMPHIDSHNYDVAMERIVAGQRAKLSLRWHDRLVMSRPSPEECREEMEYLGYSYPVVAVPGSSLHLLYGWTEPTAKMRLLEENLAQAKQYKVPDIDFAARQRVTIE